MLDAGLSGCQSARSALGLGPEPSEQVRAHEDDLARFKDVAVAIAEGYLTSPNYVYDGSAGLGIPLVNPRIEELKPTAPQALFYELTPGGRYELEGVEWLVPAADVEQPPTLFGKQFSEPMAGKTATIPRHYGLHAWLFADGVDDLFSTYASTFEPPSFVAKLHPAWDALSEFVLGTDAETAGYRNTERCVETAEGFYGIPFVKSTAGGLDVADPPVLLYRQTENWAYRLLGAEWFVPIDEADDPPTLFGQRCHEALPGHGSQAEQPRHFGLHAWLYQANPAGIFAPFNPGLQC